MTDLEFRTDMEFNYGEARELLPGVTRIVANNPSVFTFKGTNTYIIGSDDLVIIDPGPEDEAHFDAIIDYVAGRPVSHIAITHTHRDHIDGLDRLAEATKAKVAGYGRSADLRSALDAPRTTEAGNATFQPDIVLRDGDSTAIQSPAPTAQHDVGLECGVARLRRARRFNRRLQLDAGSAFHTGPCS